MFLSSSQIPKWLYILILSLCLFSITNSLYWIVSTYQPLPFNDSWLMPYLYSKFQQGHLTFYDLIINHSHHRMLVPKILYLIDYHFFNGRQIFLISIILLLHLIFALLLAQILIKTADFQNKKQQILIYSLSISLLLSPIQLANLAMGFNVQYILSFLMALLSFILVDRFKTKPILLYGLLIPSVTVGVLSLANGLLILPLLTLMMLKQKYPKFHILSIALLSIVVILSYFYQYQHLEEPHKIAYLIAHPIDFIYYILVLSANIYQYFGLKFEAIMGCFAIIFGFILLFFWLKNRVQKSFDVLFFMLLYIVISLAMIAVSRLEIGLYFASSSRYTTAVLVLWFILITSLAYFVNKPVMKNTVIMLLIGLVSISFLGTDRAKKDFTNRFNIKQKITREQNEGHLSDTTLSLSFPHNPKMIRPLVDYLYQKKLASFK